MTLQLARMLSLLLVAITSIEGTPTIPPTFPPTVPPTLAPITSNPTFAPTAVPVVAAANACKDVDCGDKGACLDGACICLQDYTGATCNTLDQCERVTCMNNAPCKVVDATAMCDCSSTAFIGDLCEIPKPTCSDNIQNQDETGVDCGGATCGVCPTCSDGIMNQDEVKIDCGGNCPPCATCGDSIMNGDETGVDCGAPGCADCNVGTDTCTDGSKNGDETGIDCGGSCAAECIAYAWRVTEWSACSTECGSGGIQTRVVDCIATGGTLNEAVVAAALCSGLHPTPAIQECSVTACPVHEWRVGEYGRCSHACGGGLQFRDVNCFSIVPSDPLNPGGIKTTLVHPSLCSILDKPDPALVCNTDACGADVKFWVSGPWSSCSAMCGGGSRTRSIMCQNPTGEDLLSTACQTDPEPGQLEECNTDACFAPEWYYCGWDECTASCGGGVEGGSGGGTMLGVQTRTVFCVDGESRSTLDPKWCEGLLKEETTMIGCNEQACDEYNWMTTTWGGCVASSLGSEFGLRERTVHCHAPDTSNALNTMCEEKASTKPMLKESCVLNQCSVLPPSVAPTSRPTMAPEASAARSSIQACSFFFLAALVSLATVA